MADTRKDKRAPVSLKVRFKSATVDEFIEHYSKDVSRGGIYIKSSQPMPVGTLLKFQFQLKDESALIKGVGRVVWTRTEDRAGEGRPAGMGIKFIKMDPESRAMVDRIVEAHTGSPGAFDEGRAASGLPDSEAPPAATENSGFFPDVGPAQLPPPEDRTAVRQAAEFLAAALSEVKDEDAAREAEKKAAEARERTAQIEAQRIAEAERQKRDADALPSMIIDPALSMPPPAQGAASSAPPPADKPPAAPDEEIPTVTGKPKPSSLPPPAAKAAQAAASASSVPPAAKPAPASPLPPASPAAPAAPAAVHSLETTTQLAPALTAPASRRSPFLPIAAIVTVLAVAGFVALRGGPNEGASQVAPAAAASEATSGAVGAAAPAPEPAPEANEPEPAAAEDNAQAPSEAPSEEEVPLFEPDPEPPQMVAIKVNTQPTGAEISVNGEAKGTSPVTLELEKGVAVTLSASLRGYAVASLEVTPSAAKSHKLLLTPLPYVLHVDTNPPGATVSGAGKRGTAPAELTWPRAPGSVFKVTAKLTGYESAEALVDPASFEEREDAMRAAVQLSLNPLPEKPQSAPKPKPVAKPAEAGDSEASSSGEAAAAAAPAVPQADTPAPAEKPQAEPAAAPEPAKTEAEPKPETAPAPKPAEAPAAPAPEAAPAQKPAPKPDEALPENPFG